MDDVVERLAFRWAGVLGRLDAVESPTPTEVVTVGPVVRALLSGVRLAPSVAGGPARLAHFDGGRDRTGKRSDEAGWIAIRGDAVKALSDEELDAVLIHEALRAYVLDRDGTEDGPDVDEDVDDLMRLEGFELEADPFEGVRRAWSST